MNHDDKSSTSLLTLNSINAILSNVYGQYTGTSYLHKFSKICEDSLDDHDSEISELNVVVNDCNILDIDVTIKRILQHKKIPPEQLQLKDKLTQLLCKPHTYSQHVTYSSQLDQIEAEIIAINSKTEYLNYITDTNLVVSDYRKLIQGSYIRVIIGNNIPRNNCIVETESTKLQRLNIISKYLNIASKYVKLNISQDALFVGNTCLICGNMCVDNGEVLECLTCGSQLPRVKETSNHTETNSYDSKQNFIKRLNKLEGKDAVIPYNLYEQLDTYCADNNYPTSSMIKELPLLHDGTKAGTSLKFLQTLLKETKNTAYREDLNLIAHEYWGWELYDLSHYKQDILRDYDTLENVYTHLKDEGETSSPNVQYKLYKLVSRYYNCHKSHFKLPQDTKKLEEKTILAYKQLNWTFSPITI